MGLMLEKFEHELETNFKGERLSTLGSSHYMASMFNEQCTPTSTIEA